MPCSEDGKPGFKWGESGACHTYDPGSEISKIKARERARKQGIAVMFSQGKIKV
ncbi:MAG: hypothetical protein O8C67_15635 [Candidatus Methanoperedens sp.]|nr:hypothetical protein [Candidatus Methanoperedens sp.]